MLKDFFAKHPSAPKELKTSAFISGTNDWSKVDATKRKEFREIQASNCSAQRCNRAYVFRCILRGRSGT